MSKTINEIYIDCETKYYKLTDEEYNKFLATIMYEQSYFDQLRKELEEQFIKDFELTGFGNYHKSWIKQDIKNIFDKFSQSNPKLEATTLSDSIKPIGNDKLSTSLTENPSFNGRDTLIIEQCRNYNGLGKPCFNVDCKNKDKCLDYKELKQK